MEEERRCRRKDEACQKRTAGRRAEEQVMR